MKKTPKMGNSHKRTGSLNEHEINFLVKNTNMSRDEILIWHKKFLIDFPNGYINKKEFGQLFKNLYGDLKGNPEKFSKFVFKAFDESSDGKISFSEFLITTSFLDSNQKPENRLELAFDIFDSNDDHKIDKK